MILLPIHQNQELNADFASDPDCMATLEVFPSFYARVGFNPPWIGYFASLDQKLVAGGGFKGAPKNGQVEIAYGVFKGFEGQGIGTEVCRQLVLIALETDPGILISARTLPENNASAEILKRNGFVMGGKVWDEEDGDVWEWFYKK